MILIIFGNDGKDAKRYQEKQVSEALKLLKKTKNKNNFMKYTIVIQWSELDDCFVVFLPDFEDVMQPVTHGDSYEGAFKNAQDVLELLVESSRLEGKPLPLVKPTF